MTKINLAKAIDNFNSFHEIVITHKEYEKKKAELAEIDAKTSESIQQWKTSHSHFQSESNTSLLIKAPLANVAKKAKLIRFSSKLLQKIAVHTFLIACIALSITAGSVIGFGLFPLEIFKAVAIFSCLSGFISGLSHFMIGKSADYLSRMQVIRQNRAASSKNFDDFVTRYFEKDHYYLTVSGREDEDLHKIYLHYKRAVQTVFASGFQKPTYPSLGYCNTRPLRPLSRYSIPRGYTKPRNFSSPSKSFQPLKMRPLPYRTTTLTPVKVSSPRISKPVRIAPSPRVRLTPVKVAPVTRVSNTLRQQR